MSEIRKLTPNGCCQKPLSDVSRALTDMPGLTVSNVRPGLSLSQEGTFSQKQWFLAKMGVFFAKNSDFLAKMVFCQKQWFPSHSGGLPKQWFPSHSGGFDQGGIYTGLSGGYWPGFGKYWTQWWGNARLWETPFVVTHPFVKKTPFSSKLTLLTPSLAPIRELMHFLQF